ncbi:MAG TPA: ABC transporter permease subunit [Jatrophihabitantaceae bacterium]|jgi:ABC-type transport system involved in multi-copper enzyme maturation permease subunit
MSAYQSTLPLGRDGFAQLLRAEWTKLRTVRGWVIGLLVAAVVTVAVGVLAAAASHASACVLRVGAAQPVCHAIPAPPTGPGGEPVSDNFYFVHQPLTGDGSITARVDSLTGLITSGDASPDQALAGARPGVQPWSKAGLIIKANTTQGSAYAAIMLTGGHGVRWQYNYTHDVAGAPGAAPRWLRLTRAGDTVTGYDSLDGTHWTRVGSARLSGLPATVPAGLFAASPDYQEISSHVGGSSGTIDQTQATAHFDQINAPTGAWTGTAIGAGGFARSDTLSGFSRSGDTLTVRGSGDIAPAVGGDPSPARGLDRTLVGTFAGLIALIVVAALFITAEYRRGLIRTTLAASPRRGRVLAAKAVVVGAVAFVAGLAAAAVAIPLGQHVLRSNGNYIYPVSASTEVRMIVGTAALLAVTAIAALAVGTMLRRGAGAVAAVIVAVVLPYILAVASVLPTSAGQWLLRVTPAAAFAVQQSLIQYPQVSGQYTPTNGYYPLSPWAGLAVLCGYTAIALGAAAYVLNRRDA